MERTSLSAGLVVRDVLLGDARVRAITRTVVPVFSPTEPLTLPYVVYRRTKLTVRSVAQRGTGAEGVEMEVCCYAASYSESVELAEAVRRALDHRQATAEGLTMRSCTLADSSEEEGGDAYAQVLVFDVRV